jgi:hypothetical protein
MFKTYGGAVSIGSDIKSNTVIDSRDNSFIVDALGIYLGANAYFDSNLSVWKRRIGGSPAGMLQIDKFAGVPYLSFSSSGSSNSQINWDYQAKLAAILSGGYKIQSGTGNIDLSGGSVKSTNVTFPTAFSAPPIVLVTVNTQLYQYTITITTYNITTSGFTLQGWGQNGGYTSTNTFDWLAIGN